MKSAVLIPCRTGSKGIPNKNFRDFAGKPLWEWTYDAAVKSGVFDKIILSSDGGFIDRLSSGKDIIDNERPSELSDDKVSLDNVLGYYVSKHEDIDIWCLLQPTSPLRTPGDIRKAHAMILKDKYESIVSVWQEKGFYWVKDAVNFQGKKMPIATYNLDKRPNRQDREDWYAENGAIYFTKSYAIKATGLRCGGEVGLYVMPKERSFEIDSPFDWKLCEHLKGGNHGLA